jgi:putative redox protein
VVQGFTWHAASLLRFRDGSRDYLKSSAELPEESKMVEMMIQYQGDMHCELTHGPSGSKIETDAPKDNMGRGERFSPTDLMGAALSSCALTTMAIVAEREGLAVDLRGAKARVTKIMNPAPRRVASLPLVIEMPLGIPHDKRARIELAANECPVKRSLHPDIQATIEFQYRD